MPAFEKTWRWIGFIGKSTLAVVGCGLTMAAFAGPAEDEQLLGLWQSAHGCVVHIFEDESGSLAGAAWGQRKESAELVIEFSGDRRFAWKRKTKKSGFGDDGEVDPKRSGRFIVDLHDRQVLHSDNWPCFYQRTGPGAKFSRQSPTTASKLSVPDWYSDTLSLAIAGSSDDGTAKSTSQAETSQSISNTTVNSEKGMSVVEQGCFDDFHRYGGSEWRRAVRSQAADGPVDDIDLYKCKPFVSKDMKTWVGLDSSELVSNKNETLDSVQPSTTVVQSLQAADQNNQTGQTVQGGGLGGLLNALNNFNQQMQEQASGQFPEAASDQSQSSTQLGSGTDSGGLTGLFGAAGKKKNTASASSDQGQLSATGSGGLSSEPATSGQPSSNSGTGPSNLQEFRELVTMGPVDAHFLGKAYAGHMFGDAPALPATDRRVQYVQAVLDTLARYSRVPFVYRSYVAIILDDYETVNAYTAPGGFLAVYTGMLNIFENEDELALVLAHELAHSELNHGISAVVTEQSAKFFQGFAGDIVGNDLVGGFVSSLYDIGVKGYNVEIEAEADARALLIAQRAGYDPGVFPGVMEKFRSVKGHYGGEGYPPNRAELIQRHLTKVSYLGSAGAFAARSARFHAVFGH